MNTILIIFMFMVGCEVPAGVLSYQFLNFSSAKEVYIPDCRGLYKNEAIQKLSSEGLEHEIIYLPYNKNVEPGVITHMVPNPFTKIKTGRSVSISVSGHKQTIEVPELKNMSLRNAKILIENTGFVLDTILYNYSPVVKKGSVISQKPLSGTIMLSGESISINISRGHPSYYYIMPDLVNLPFKTAKEKILSEGFRLGKILYVHNPNLLPNTVISQSIPAGIKIEVPIAISLEVTKIDK